MYKKYLNDHLRRILAPKVARAGLLMLCLFVLMSCASTSQTTPQATKSVPQGFTMRSPDFQDGGSLSKHNESALSARGCHGDNVAPTLQWTGIPGGTRSFALTMYDVDANHSHWVVFNIPGNENELHAHPLYAEGLNTAQLVGYNGPCPTPNGQIHHYVFTLYALSVATIEGDKTLTYEELLSRIAHNVQGKTSITATFARTSNT